MKVSVCPECKRRWPWVGDQAAAIKLIGHCIVCWDKELDGELRRDFRIMIARLDENGIIAERLRREKVAGYTVEPCPSCLHRRDENCNRCGGLGSIRVDVEKTESEPDRGRDGSDDEREGPQSL